MVWWHKENCDLLTYGGEQFSPFFHASFGLKGNMIVLIIRIIINLLWDLAHCKLLSIYTNTNSLKVPKEKISLNIKTKILSNLNFLFP